MRYLVILVMAAAYAVACRKSCYYLERHHPEQLGYDRRGRMPQRTTWQHFVVWIKAPIKVASILVNELLQSTRGIP